MRRVYILILSAALFGCGGEGEESNETGTDSTATETEEVSEEVEAPEKKAKSPRLQASGSIDGVQVDIDYGSPYVKERTIWGDLVAYDKVWRAGANEATAITFSTDVLFGDAEVAAGTYALFVKPMAEGDWEVILNEEWSKEEHGVWGAYDHDPTKDIARVDIAPTWNEELQESLEYQITDGGVMFAWEYATFTVGIQAK